MPTRVGQKGQVVIEKAIRDALGVQPGSIAVQRQVGDHVELRFYPPEHERSLAGMLAGELDRGIGIEEWSEAKQAAWVDPAELEETDASELDAEVRS